MESKVGWPVLGIGNLRCREEKDIARKGIQESDCLEPCYRMERNIQGRNK